MAHARRDQPLVPSFAVKLNGQPLVADMALWIVRIVVEDDINLPGMFTLELISKEGERTTTPWTDDARLALGARVDISMGYGEDRESLIVGQITALEPTFGIGGPPTLKVYGFNDLWRLNGTRRTRSFVDQTDADIAEQICSDAKVPVDTTDSGVSHPYVLQADQTDLEFLCERARRIHYELVMNGDTVLFRPVANAASSVVTLTLEDDLLDFWARASLVPLTELQVRGWDPKEKQAISASSAAGSNARSMSAAQTAAEHAEKVLGTMVEALTRAPVSSQAEADQIAAAQFNGAALDFIRGDGRARGRTDVRAGRVIRLVNLGERFSGEYYVTSATHRYSRRDGYLTDFRVRRNGS